VLRLKRSQRKQRQKLLIGREVSKAKLSFFTRLMENISEVFKGTERKDLEIALSMRMAKIVEELAHSLAEKGLLSPRSGRNFGEDRGIQSTFTGRKLK